MNFSQKVEFFQHLEFTFSTCNLDCFSEHLPSIRKETEEEFCHVKCDRSLQDFCCSLANIFAEAIPGNLHQSVFRSVHVQYCPDQLWNSPATCRYITVTEEPYWSNFPHTCKFCKTSSKIHVQRNFGSKHFR